MPSSDLDERYDAVTTGRWSPEMFEALVRDNPDMIAVIGGVFDAAAPVAAVREYRQLFVGAR